VSLRLSPPDLHLRRAPALARVVLVEAGEIAVVALVERLVGGGRQAGLAEFAERERERVLRADQRGGEREIERQPARLQPAPRRARLLDSPRREIRVPPAGEQVFEIPVALAVAQENEEAIGGRHGSPGWRRRARLKSTKPARRQAARGVRPRASRRTRPPRSPDGPCSGSSRPGRARAGRRSAPPPRRPRRPRPSPPWRNR
jgi:hypothetical protein